MIVVCITTSTKSKPLTLDHKPSSLEHFRHKLTTIFFLYISGHVGVCLPGAKPQLLPCAALPQTHVTDHRMLQEPRMPQVPPLRVTFAHLALTPPCPHTRSISRHHEHRQISLSYISSGQAAIEDLVLYARLWSRQATGCSSGCRITFPRHWTPQLRCCSSDSRSTIPLWQGGNH